jgi:MFS transporter, DHA1 family, tetracycline resistance protein
MNQKRPAALIFIFFTVLIDVIGFGIIIPVIPNLLATMLHADLSTAATYGGWLLAVYSVVQFLFAPVMGGLSDQYGRRPVLLLSLFGFGIDYLLVVFASTIGWFFLARIVAGITGSSITTATAYIADVSPPEKRAQNFGILGVAFGLGFIIGPIIGGVLATYGLKAPFIGAAILTLVNWLYGYFVLPESLPKENRRPFDWKRANPLGSLKQLGKYPAISGLVLSLVLIYVSAHAVQTTWGYYNMKKFAWTEAQVGYSLGFVGVMVALVQGLLIRFIIPKLGKERSLYTGLFLYSIGMVLFGIAGQPWMMYAFTVVYCMGGIAGPSLQGIISNYVPANEQGELQGGLTSLMSITSIIGPPFMTYLFSYFTAVKAPVYFPGAPFIAGALLMLASAILAYRSLKATAVRENS